MVYVLTRGFVDASLGTLLSQRTHPHFAGYLCLKRTAARDSTTRGLKPDFRGFFETFFAVPNAPAGKPYVRPFWDEERTAAKVWYQPNVAGSYSAGSARRIPAFMAVVRIEGQGRTATYSLRDGHWRLAFQHLAYGQKIDALALAGFLYRDFGFESDTLSSASVLVDVFRDEFGYPRTRRGNREFETLYLDESAAGSSAEWFEPIPDASGVAIE